MTLLEILRFVKKYFFFLTAVSLIGALAGYFITRGQTPLYEASQTIFVKRQTSLEGRPYYTYDGYYSVQAAERFADSLLGILKSREVLKFALSQSVSSGSANWEKEVGKIKVRRLSPQLVSYAYRSLSRGQAEELISALSAAVTKLARDLNEGGDVGLSFSFISPRPLVTVKSVSLIINVGLGVFLGGFLASIIAAGHYFVSGLKL